MQSTRMKRFLLLLIIVVQTAATFAQYNVSGTVVDSKDGQALPSAVATLTRVGESKPIGQSTDLDGKFTITKVASGKYVFRINYTGYAAYEKNITVGNDNVKLGTIRMKPETKNLDEVKVTGVLQRQEQRGDTTIFNAEAFKVNPDATTEDLIKKMPGIQVSGSTVTAGGETVKKVLVDGKEFFGSDPMVALKNIQADMVDKIEVYDKQSDQAAFTGFSDGNEEKTINIMTKFGLSSGYFGRVYAGYGTDDRYELGGNINFFGGKQRISVIGMLNNINQQNFAFDDVTGAMSMGGGRSMRGMFSAGQGGKNRTGSIGFNYCYEAENKLKIELSYFYNNNKNKSNSTSMQEYFQDDDDDSLRVYSSESYGEGLNNNHRASLRLTWTINDKNSIIFTPNISWQGYTSESSDSGDDTYDGNLYSTTIEGDDSKTTGLSGSGDILWRHKFNIDRRTLSLRIGTTVSTSNADETSQSISEYINDESRNLMTSQLTDNDSKSTKIDGSIMYTEPIGSLMALQVNYSPSYTISDGDKYVEADSIDSADEEFGNYEFSSLLSNKKKSEYWQHKAGLGLNIALKNGFHATLGLDAQYATLDGDQEYPYEFETNKDFTSILPSVRLRWRKNRTMHLRFDYRTNTSAPSISQLQNVVDVSSTRTYTGGNEDLSQQYSHEIRLMFAANNPETSRAIFLRGDYTATSDYIATASYVMSVDSIIDNDITLPAGTQYNKPINMSGYYSANLNLTLSTPVSWLGSNVNLNLGATLQSKPSKYNNKKVTSDTYALNGGLTIGSSFSENIDFTISYNGSYNIVKSTAAASSNYNYYSHTASADLNCLFWTRLVFANTLSHQMTSGMGDDYDQNYLTWNAALGYKFFKDRRGELRFKVNDILDSNSSVSRSIQDAYIQTATTDVLRRYCLLTFTYKFKPKGNAPQSQDGPPPGMHMGPPPGGGGGPR